MALVTWDSKYSVGVKSLDSQHTVLFNLINELHAAMMKGQAQQVTGSLLNKLVDYTRNHFAAEESMMSLAQFSGLAQHKVKHKELLKQVDDFVVRFERGESTLNVQLLTFLRDWLTNHILREDHAYGPVMNAKGVK